MWHSTLVPYSCEIFLKCAVCLLLHLPMLGAFCFYMCLGCTMYLWTGVFHVVVNIGGTTFHFPPHMNGGSVANRRKSFYKRSPTALCAHVLPQDVTVHRLCVQFLTPFLVSGRVTKTWIKYSQRWIKCRCEIMDMNAPISRYLSDTVYVKQTPDPFITNFAILCL